MAIEERIVIPIDGDLSPIQGKLRQLDQQIGSKYGGGSSGIGATAGLMPSFVGGLVGGSITASVLGGMGSGAVNFTGRVTNDPNGVGLGRGGTPVGTGRFYPNIYSEVARMGPPTPPNPFMHEGESFPGEGFLKAAAYGGGGWMNRAWREGAPGFRRFAKIGGLVAGISMASSGMQAGIQASFSNELSSFTNNLNGVSGAGGASVGASAAIGAIRGFPLLGEAGYQIGNFGADLFGVGAGSLQLAKDKNSASQQAQNRYSAFLNSTLGNERGANYALLNNMGMSGTAGITQLMDKSNDAQAEIRGQSGINGSFQTRRALSANRMRTFQESLGVFRSNFEVNEGNLSQYSSSFSGRRGSDSARMIDLLERQIDVMEKDRNVNIPR